jgi:8-oxo-dGTP pyrophosphatase MutT (NUDIX family)
MTPTLTYKANPFGGVVIEPQTLPDNPQDFRSNLRRSMDLWRSDGVLVVWLEIPIKQAALVPVAVESGFTYHHTGDDYLLLTCALAEGSHIPPYASHYIGAGGVVLTEDRELLVVREKFGFGGRPATLKLPGGALRSGEHLADAVVREVLEETGVETEFQSVVCFRHWHGYRYGKSDIYFVCRLTPLSREITMQTQEIQECIWMPVDEFLGSESVADFNKWIVNAGLSVPGMGVTSVVGYPAVGDREFFVSEG